jgi:hypothetical protein
MRSRIKLKKQFGANPKKHSKARPIAPRSVIAVRESNPGPHRTLLGQLLRVGYYSKQDGLNVIWLVYEDGQYGETTSHQYLNRHFRVIVDSGETDFFGDSRPKLLPLSEEEIAALEIVRIATASGA